MSKLLMIASKLSVPVKVVLFVLSNKETRRLIKILIDVLKDGKITHEEKTILKHEANILLNRIINP